MNEDELRKEGDRLLASANLPGESLVGMATGMHEIYISLKEGGFNKYEALWLIGYILTGGAKPTEEEG